MSGTLGYMDLISMAKAHSQNKQKELERNKLLAAKEKKADPKQVKLKVGVQKFLAKKEEEERQRREIADRKRNQLLELRNQDRKATSRVSRMLKLTKSANKSVIADAKECLTDSCNAQGAEPQPDEDDYGYTSTFANEMHKKIVAKYQTEAKKAPLKLAVEVPKSHSIQSSSSSSKSGKSGSGNGSSKDSGDRDRDRHRESQNHSQYHEPEKPKKKAMPPPPSFHDLLKMAEEKSKEPIVIQKPVKDNAEENYEFGRPMTKREKAKYSREFALKKKVEASFNTMTLPPKEKPKPAESHHSKQFVIPKNGRAVENKPNNHDMKYKSEPPQTSSGRFLPPKNDKRERERERESSSSNSNLQNRNPVASSSGYSGSHSQKSSYSKTVPESSNNLKRKPISNGSNNEKSYRTSPNDRGYSARSPKYSKSRDDRSMSPPHRSSQGYSTQKSRTASPRDRDSGSRARAPPAHYRHPAEITRRGSPPSRHGHGRMGYDSRREEMPRREKPHKGRPVIYSDEEEDYDSEMDDFIDDSDLPGEDISSVIGQIFGYNKNKFKDVDEDVDDMETPLEEQWKEERKTLRIGKLEDLEEERRLKEAEQRKAERLKRERMMRR